MALFATALALLMLAGTALAQGTTAIPWSVLGGGGGHTEAGGISLDGTIGQPIVGTVSQGNYELCAGFWCGTAQYLVYLPLVMRGY